MRIIFLIMLVMIFSFAIFATETLVVVNRADSTVALIDATSMKVLSTIATGNGPHEVVVTPDGKTAIVSIYGAQTPGSQLAMIDIATRKETKRIDLLPFMRPHGLVEYGGKIYFTAESNRMIGRFDPKTEKVDWAMGTGQNGSHMVAITPDQKRFYSANIGSDTVTAFEFADVPPAGSKIIHIPVGKQPEAIAVSPDGKQVWAGLNAENAIDVIDTSVNKVVEKIKVGERPYRICFSPDGKIVVSTIPNTKELVFHDALTRKETKRISLIGSPLGVIFSSDGKLAYVTVTQENFVLKIDVEKGEVVGQAATGNASDGVALAIGK